MSEFEWTQRAVMHYANRTKDYQYNWSEWAKNTYIEMKDDFQFEPEDAVDEEISYWD